MLQFLSKTENVLLFWPFKFVLLLQRRKQETFSQKLRKLHSTSWDFSDLSGLWSNHAEVMNKT